MRPDDDDRHGRYIPCGKFVLEKCDCQTPALRSGHRCDAENSVPFGIFLPFGTHFQRFAGAVTIFSYYRKAGILSLLVAAIIAFSRLYFFVHYPTDILGGMVLGTLDAVLAVYIVKRLEDRVDVKTISHNDKTGHK